MMINLIKVLRGVFVVQTTVPTGVSQSSAVRGALVTRTCRKEVNAVKVTGTTETFRNIKDGTWRWTCSTDVVCSAWS